MDIDELKNGYAGLRAPDRFGQMDQERTGGFVKRLMDADKKSRDVLRRFYIIYFSIAAFYFVLFIINPDAELKLNDRINGTLLFIGIMLFAVLAKMKYSKLRKNNYDQDTISFLKEALGRYKFWTTEMNYVALGVMIINVGSCRSYVMHYPQFNDILFDILLFQLVFLTAMAVGLFFGLRHWKTHQESIFNKINLLLNEEN